MQTYLADTHTMRFGKKAIRRREQLQSELEEDDLDRVQDPRSPAAEFDLPPRDLAAEAAFLQDQLKQFSETVALSEL